MLCLLLGQDKNISKQYANQFEEQWLIQAIRSNTSKGSKSERCYQRHDDVSLSKLMRAFLADAKNDGDIDLTNEQLISKAEQYEAQGFTRLKYVKSQIAYTEDSKNDEAAAKWVKERVDQGVKKSLRTGQSCGSCSRSTKSAD